MGWILWHPAFTEAGPTAPKDMAWIPPGEFVMGLEGAGNKTPHKVFLDGFFIDKYEVTQEDYESQRGANPSKFTGRKNPVEQVTWYEARAYCAKLGKRLPTEAEWEKAARGGTATLYFWGPEMDAQYAWFDDNSDDQTHPVGGRQPNAYGLHDTSGNVWEWVGDWYEKKYYERSPAKNPKGPESGVDKTLRGGSWYSSGRHLTTATRYWSGPNVRNSNFGFRCAKDAPQD
ncbi:MAG: SUMF1/EgtB/PvdO family nonheme iron enzyme [Nitrospinaceae bacterium]|nr:formylglycine-generating enzyme family protein [Nitrospinaceae bacterium]NIR56605.1 formylglycine-generating enzyme family protein [Nitrospinaceae bacterium]NIS87066.1 formylglycine-generating enzyme family protein [Nitrospinaceae bacterium]NIT83920.1 formylglycine-generating enzyme family protein [Nitrospinaceae bacterium]NIU46113.1 formylglycine-generating enzyme family protein [Nitrospinaceae bacterium]